MKYMKKKKEIISAVKEKARTADNSSPRKGLRAYH